MFTAATSPHQSRLHVGLIGKSAVDGEGDEDRAEAEAETVAKAVVGCFFSGASLPLYSSVN